MRALQQRVPGPRSQPVLISSRVLHTDNSLGKVCPGVGPGTDSTVIPDSPQIIASPVGEAP